MAHSLTAVEAAGRSRVVVNLVRSVAYDINMQGDTVLLTLGQGAPTVAPTASSSVFSNAQFGGVHSITDIDFRRGDDGEGRIIVTLSDPSVGVNLGQEGGQLVIDFISVSLPAELDRRLDVIDFATPVKEIDTSASANGARMI